MVNTGEAIPKLVPAKAGTALEAATLPSYQIKFDRALAQGTESFFYLISMWIEELLIARWRRHLPAPFGLTQHVPTLNIVE